MRCPNCQAANESYASKCQFCGTPLKDSNAEMKPPVKDVVLGKAGSTLQGSGQVSKEQAPEKVVSTPRQKLEQAGLPHRKIEEKRSVGVLVVGRVMFIYSIFLFINWIVGRLQILPLFSPYPFLLLFMKLPLQIYYKFPLLFFLTVSFVGFSIWMIYLISSIGILKLKNWGRLLGIYFSGLIALVTGVAAVYDLIRDPSIFHPISFFYILNLPLLTSLNDTFGTALALFIAFYPIVLALLFIIFLTRPKVKEQFK